MVLVNYSLANVIFIHISRNMNNSAWKLKETNPFCVKLIQIYVKRNLPKQCMVIIGIIKYEIGNLNII